MKNLWWLLRNLDWVIKVLYKASRYCDKVDDLERKVQSTNIRAINSENKAEKAEQYLREATTHFVDMGRQYDKSYVVVVGKYYGNDYVQVLDLPPNETEPLIKMMRQVKDVSGRGYYDTPAPVLKDWLGSL